MKMLEKVKKHRIGGKIGRWIEEFIKDRKFRVVVNGYMSEEENVISGVPQGTVLAAILFVIMISDIDENVKKSIVRSFADDTRVNKMINNPNDIEEMQRDLENIYEWAERNKMVFNENKFEQMTFGNTNNAPRIQYKTPSGVEIQSKDNIKDLGIIVQGDLNFSEHINKIATECIVIMGMLLRMFETREREPMIKMFNSYLKSQLEYCCRDANPFSRFGVLII